VQSDREEQHRRAAMSPLGFVKTGAVGEPDMGIALGMRPDPARLDLPVEADWDRLITPALARDCGVTIDRTSAPPSGPSEHEVPAAMILTGRTIFGILASDAACLAARVRP
jgi:hypothetical protein